MYLPWLITRYFCANSASAKIVPMPKKAETHIQKIAPGPPDTIAVATPATLPVPICAEIATAKAWNCDSDCASFSFLANKPPNTDLNAAPNLVICGAPR